MPKLIVGPIEKGLRTDRLPFNIDNDSFPTLINAYEWRGRLKRKRGTSLLGRLTRFFNSNSTSYSAVSTINLSSGSANILTGFSLQANGNLIPGTVIINDTTASKFYGDGQQNGNLSPAASITGATQANPCVLTANNSFSIGDKVYINYVKGMTQLNGNTYTITNVSGTTITINVDSTAFGAYTSGGFATDISVTSGTINYATGVITITGGASDAISVMFLYYPDLPVMGLEEFSVSSSFFPGTLAFDTIYSYNISTDSPYNIYDVSFYKNPVSGTYRDYVAKTTVTPTSWNGQDYQQFWTVNYEGALWATNGTNIPFNITNIGMQYKFITGVSIVNATNPAKASITITAHGLAVGDFLFINEVGGITGINFQTGYVITVTDANTVVVEFPNATLGGAYTSGGIAQYLTNRSDKTKDCIRWYDGDPTDGNATNPSLIGHLGWVNFMPPLSRGSFSLGEQPAAQYYLVGCKMIIPFSGRLLFVGPVIQASGGNPIYLQDSVAFSQAGTPYYTASFTGDVSAANTQFFPILTPGTQTGFPAAYFSDQTGFGGVTSAGLQEPILTGIVNENVLILGFAKRQTRFVYSGDDNNPFLFFTINAELGSSSTFSNITLDRGAVTIGLNGIIITDQTSVTRIDLDIPDQVFHFNLTNTGFARITAQRDFINEWVYFTYLSNQQIYTFPNQTLQYNYRENSWAVFNEAYTTYGQFRRQTGYTWATLPFATWEAWNEPWNAGISTLLQPQVIGGNQQGFVLFRDMGTNEGNSLYIQSISGTTVTSPNHTLNDGDYIIINGAIGMNNTNGFIFSVTEPSTNSFVLGLAPGQLAPSGTYVGGGLIQRMYVPFIQSKQFPVAWELARKTRIGAQQYLISTTSNGQITLLIFLSMNDASPYNLGPIVPNDESTNNTLVYSTLLYTCPESTNLGLTPANTNLQMVTALDQNQIWHRMNTSLLGDTVQVGFTMSDAQMRDTSLSNQFAEIEIHGFILDVTPSQMLA